MAGHEVRAFRRALGVSDEQVRSFDLLTGSPSPRQLEAADAVLIGGSGDHSVVRGGPWLAGALRAMETLFERSKPTFASCWGFQALARALGGRVVTDHARAEVGVVDLELTPAGEQDPVFGPLGRRFQAVIGHEDIVTDLPRAAQRLASSPTVANEALSFPGKPIYATQFHPELDPEAFLHRIAAYPPYLPLAGARTIRELRERLPATIDTAGLLTRFREEALPPRLRNPGSVSSVRPWAR